MPTAISDTFHAGDKIFLKPHLKSIAISQYCFPLLFLWLYHVLKDTYVVKYYTNKNWNATLYCEYKIRFKSESNSVNVWNEHKFDQ